MNFKICLIFLKILLVNSSFLSNSVNNFNEKISRCIGNLIDEWNGLDPGVHDVQIYRSGAQISRKPVNDFTDNLLKIIPDENAVFIRDLDSDLVNDTLRPGAFKIILSDLDELTSLNFPPSSSFWEITSKYIFLPTNSSLTTQQFVDISEHFRHYGILDFVAITGTSSPKIFTHNPFFNKTEIIPGKSGKFREIFKDKLSNLNGYEYEIFLRYQSGRIIYENGTLKGATVFFLDILLEKQNASYKMKHYETPFGFNYDFQKFMNKFNAGQFDLVLTSTLLKTPNNSEPICSYLPNEFCVSVPTTYIRKSFQYFLVNEFTWKIAVQGLGIVFLGSAIWSFIYFKKLSRSPDSPCHFLFAIFGYCVGQGVSFRRPCLLQKYLAQLFIFGLFFLSNLYTATVISIQGENNEFLEINSFADAKSHNLSIRAPIQGYKVLNDSNYDPEFMRLLKVAMNPFELLEAIENKEGIFARCSVIRIESERSFGYAHDSYYTLGEKFSSNFEYFYYNRLNPYRLKFQHYKNLVFEAGLEHYYYLTHEPKSLDPVKPKPAKPTDDGTVTRFEDLYFALLMFLAGNLLAFLVLIVEIVWFRLSKYLEKRRLRKNFHYIP